MAWLLIVIVAAVMAAAYLVSLWVHPWTACRKCDGSGKSRDRIWRGAYGTCPAAARRGPGSGSCSPGGASSSRPARQATRAPTSGMTRRSRNGRDAITEGK